MASTTAAPQERAADRAAAQLAEMCTARMEAAIAEADAGGCTVADFPAPVGAVVAVSTSGGARVEGEVVGHRDRWCQIQLYDRHRGLRPGDVVRLLRTRTETPTGDSLLGRVIDARGRSLDDEPDAAGTRKPVQRSAPPPGDRPPIRRALPVGVRAVDALLTVGRGQRLGVFSGPGIGKTVLLGMLARGTTADVNVIALVGERGREVNEFVQHELDAETMARTVIVTEPGDAAPALRVRAAQAAMTIAEEFRDAGRDVLLVVDSLTRLAQAQREVALAAGEPPAARGYPPSVFSLLPQLTERAGATRRGSITGFFSVLTEEDAWNDPVADSVRGLLDGHLVLSRRIAESGRYPAIDFLESISRCMANIVDEQTQHAAAAVRRLAAVHRDHADLIAVGAYRRGSDAWVDAALALQDELHALLEQPARTVTRFEDAQQALAELAKKIAAAVNRPNAAPPAGAQNAANPGLA